MKWSDEQTAKLRELCFAEVPNAEIAKQFGVPVTEVHSKRSQLGITIPKVKAAKGQASRPVTAEFKSAQPTRCKQLPHGVQDAFNKLNEELLLAMARNGTSLEDAKSYGLMAELLAAVESCCKRWINSGATENG